MNRNIYISIDKNHNLENYQTIPIENISTIVNGYITNIICECLDQVEYTQRELVAHQIITKISFEGFATFKFLNASILGAKILKNELDSEKLSIVIKNLKSIWTESKITDFFASIPNIVVQKNYIEHIYTVITICKQL
jgi:hypothetical protein